VGVLYDAASIDDSAIAAGGDLSWTHSPSGTPKGALVFVVAYFSGGTSADEITSVTYGGVSMTEVSASPQVLASTEDFAVHAFFLGSGVPTGNQTVAVTTSASNASQQVGYCVTFTADSGYDTAVEDADFVNSTSASNPSVSLTIPSGDAAVVIGIATGAGTAGISAAGSHTQLYETDLTSRVAALHRRTNNLTADGAATYTASADEQCAIFVAVKQVLAATGVTVSPGLASLTLTGFAPTVTTAQVVRPDVAALSFEGFAPTISVSGGSVTVTPDVATLTLTGFAPTILTAQTVSPGLASLTITGFEPTVNVGFTVAPGAADLTLTTFAPTITTAQIVTPGLADLALTGFEPSIVVEGGDAVVRPGYASLVLESFAPTILGGEVAVAAEQPAGGGRSRKSRRKYAVEIDGEEFLVESVAEAESLLRQAEEIAAEKAAKQVERAATQKKSRRAVVKDARRALPLPQVRVVGSDTDATAAAIESALRASMQRIEEQYKSAIRSVEIAALMRMQAEQDEEEALITLLMTL
jgi:hypothetical protein